MYLLYIYCCQSGFALGYFSTWDDLALMLDGISKYNTTEEGSSFCGLIILMEKVMIQNAYHFDDCPHASIGNKDILLSSVSFS